MEGAIIKITFFHENLGMTAPEIKIDLSNTVSQLKIKDLNPSSMVNMLNDPNVQKYEISEENYDQREDSFRKFKQTQYPNKPQPQKPKIDDNFQQELAAQIQAEQRCRIKNEGDQRGTVKYVGKLKNGPLGYFVGIQLDEPLGKNDGSYQDQRYFTCQQNYGIFLRPGQVEIGDFKTIEEEFEL